MPRRNIYLVPGFFGFTSLGALNYFAQVGSVLQDCLRARGIDAEVIECATQPTGSIRRRAERLLERVVDTGGLDADSLHFVGHSTGGLDIRLLVTPGVRLLENDSEIRLGELTRDVITVATPHFGTPLAGFFTTMAGRQLLEALTVLATTTGGRYALYAGARALRLAARIDDLIGRDETFLDIWVRRLLDRISTDSSDPIWKFLRDVSADQGAIIQLTPESMHLFNAAVTDRDNARYASIVTAAPPPPRHYGTSDLRSIARAAMAGTFTLLHALAGREHPHYRYPHEGIAAIYEGGATLPFEVTPRTNDGVVPTLSQVYGDVLGVVQGDHLDICGQYPRGDHAPYSDWLPSGSGFDDARFHSSWDLVAERIALPISG